MGIFVALGEPDLEELTNPESVSAIEEVEETVAPEKKEKPAKSAPAKSESKKAKPKIEVPAQKAVMSKIVSEEAPVKAVEEVTKTKKKKVDKKKIAAKEAAEKAEREAAEEAKKKSEAEAKAKSEAEAKAKAEAAEAARKKAEAAKRKAQKKADAKSKFSSMFGKTGSDKSASKGQTNGHPDAKALEGLSTGKGKAGEGLGDRGVVFSPTITDNTQKTGRVVVDICIDKSGKVISANYTQKGSTTTDAYLIDLAETNAKKYKFLKSDIEEQCGDIIIDFKLK